MVLDKVMIIVMPDAASNIQMTPNDGVRPSPDTDVQPVAVPIPAKIRIALYSTLGLNAASYLSRKQFDFGRFAEMLNSLQDSFEFTAFDSQWDLRDYDELHIYKDDRYFDRLREAKAEHKYTYAIVITANDLERSVFNTHRELEGIGIITVSHYLEYLPPAGTLRRYLAFLVLCETLCIVGRYQFEHSQQSCCLFDMCRNKRDLTQSLSRPQIESGCEAALEAAGFSEKHIDDAYAILSYVGTPSWPQIAFSGIREPGAGFIAGITATLGAAILLTVCVTAAEAVFAATGVLWVVMIYFMALRGRPKGPRRTGRLKRFRILLSRQ